MGRKLPRKNLIYTPASDTTETINYSEKLGILEIRFTGGRTYHYTGVPEKVWNEYKKIVQEGGSSGNFVNYKIKPLYKYTEV